VKVAELEGALLDAWVARAEGYNVVPATCDPQGCWVEDGGDPFPYRPSTDWRQGGPIIERERIHLIRDLRDERWLASARVIWLPDHDDFVEGDTALIAAMRAFVASKFGDEVPDALESGASGTE
jgi:hypothetical protein